MLRQWSHDLLAFIVQCTAIAHEIVSTGTGTTPHGRLLDLAITALSDGLWFLRPILLFLRFLAPALLPGPAAPLGQRLVGSFGLGIGYMPCG